MHLIKVSATNSTNSFAREMFRENPQMSPACIVAKKQLQGRGQRGTSWHAEEGKNLTFSVFYPQPRITPAGQFLLSAAVATALLSSLDKFELPRLKVKWPNDILSGNLKIAGILIENIISEGKVMGSIIGIGLNVNQEQFHDLPSAGSMKKVSGKQYDLDDVLQVILKDLQEALKNLSENNSEMILKTYKNHLFRKDLPSTFRLPTGKMLVGMITDVSQSGKLLVQTEDDSVSEYDLKEIQLCY